MQWVSFGSVALVAVVAWIVLLTAPPPLPSSGVRQDRPPSTPLRATFVGDGFTAATPFGGAGQAGSPALVPSKSGGQPRVIAADSAGYRVPGVTGRTIPN